MIAYIETDPKGQTLPDEDKYDALIAAGCKPSDGTYNLGIVAIYDEPITGYEIAAWMPNELMYATYAAHDMPIRWVIAPLHWIQSMFPSLWKDFHSGSSDIPVGGA